MKLAEALQERADLNRNIEQLRKRLNSNVLVQEGERTAEEPERLKRELDASVERLAYLISRIIQEARRLTVQEIRRLRSRRPSL